ncbi:YggS family pyridoxal phosphate-dependent enzyme [Pseudoglutamicibacter albus]|uniref:YggS family pyridoxal phosphate-dependent enzyme n=1 Tax=Pseudoglutamicibacter albus TaxID=98671 RepID=UPI000A9AE406|nr:YggS family pyridoxal phosphate-dependent enzyme [Pseudoglutamicibacter albus]
MSNTHGQPQDLQTPSLNATDSRREELAARLSAVKERITRATKEAGRTEEPTLIVVTKFFPPSDVAALYDLGVRNVGENREQEATPKAAALAEYAPDLRWHFIGQLQSNKVNRVVRYAQEIHSVDRASLVKALARAGQRRVDEGFEPLGCYVQVDVRKDQPDDGRGGVSINNAPELADSIAENPGLQLRGVMTVAPLDEAPEIAFQRIGELAHRIQETHPDASGISAGMSHDLEQAIFAGATHLRIGSDVLGSRSPVR